MKNIFVNWRQLETLCNTYNLDFYNVLFKDNLHEPLNENLNSTIEQHFDKAKQIRQEMIENLRNGVL